MIYYVTVDIKSHILQIEQTETADCVINRMGGSHFDTYVLRPSANVHIICKLNLGLHITLVMEQLLENNLGPFQKAVRPAQTSHVQSQSNTNPDNKVLHYHTDLVQPRM